MPSRILLVDDNPAALKAIREVLEGHGHWAVCGEAHDGVEAIALAASLSPDLVVMDLSMPRMNGIQAGQKIHAATPNIPLLLFTLHIVDARMEVQARAAGFMGATSKGSYDSIVNAIEALLSGKAWFPASSATPPDAAGTEGAAGQMVAPASENVPRPSAGTSDDLVPEDAASDASPKGRAPNNKGAPEDRPADSPGEILRRDIVPEFA
jgi:DNA-binding NarL/FixJ family response regulator